ncbi:MAG TPA: hypothetical protein VLA00_11820 [Xanthobacteraceae bacterium]|nr:hypothetical protein [Xanthobacteraceae bacterium]
MRIVPFAVAAIVASFAFGPAQAQDGAGTRIIIQKPAAKSYLDPGTVVKPGSRSYLDYVGNVRTPFMSYGLDGTITGSRYPLPDRYYLPGF